MCILEFSRVPMYKLHYDYIYKKKNIYDRSSHPEVFLGKGVLKICNKFTGEHPSRSVI